MAVVLDRHTIEALKPITTEDLNDLIETYLAARQNAQANREGLEGWRKNYPMPVIARQYDSVLAYSFAVIEAQRWVECIHYKEQDVAKAEEALKSAEAKLLGALPYGIWIRHGDVGVGKAYTNWGGNRHYIVAQTWQDEMPDLDQTYRGD